MAGWKTIADRGESEELIEVNPSMTGSASSGFAALRLFGGTSPSGKTQVTFPISANSPDFG
jgi:hypothetical protein